MKKLGEREKKKKPNTNFKGKILSLKTQSSTCNLNKTSMTKNAIF